MSIFSALRHRLVRWEYQRLADYLSNVDPEAIEKESEQRVLTAFRRWTRAVPAYRELASLPAATLADFKRNVPVCDKESHFQGHDLRSLCPDGDLSRVRLFYSSSGSSRVFSYGAESWQDPRRSALELEFVLHDSLSVFDRKTLIVNGLPMGVKVHTRTIPLIESGTRADVVWALLKKLKNEFDQFVIFGEPLFLKHLIEGGIEENVPWRELAVHLVTGSEYVAENYRSYLGGLLGIDFENRDTGSITINYGLSEIANSLAHETPETILARRRAHADPALRKTIYGTDTRLCPAILQYHPYQNYLETLGPPGETGELVVTTPDAQKNFPLVRYNTKDAARLVGYGEFDRRLREAGLESRRPRFRLPFVFGWGKVKALKTTFGPLNAEEIKEALYADPEVAARFTGRFRLRMGENRPTLILQLRPGVKTGDGASAGVAKGLCVYTAAEIAVRAIPFSEYSDGFAPDFDRKTVYID